MVSLMSPRVIELSVLSLRRVPSLTIRHTMVLALRCVAGCVKRLPVVWIERLIFGLVKERIKEPDCESGFLFDGFPRTIPQADAMKEAGVPIDAVVDIDVPDEEIIKRMSGRRVHLASGRTYHIVFNPPKEEGKDDETGEPLIQRDDDQEETVRKRLDVYHAQTEPLVSYYQDWEKSGETAAPQYIRIDGVGKVDQIRDQIFSALDGLK